ncbi:hypothetical protein PCANC_22795 [Puccinia coronata f. sp. avenae]|uniref:Uncharacterized protein n=1 Tax=Puccinia coronata f. sp. avenae TaxID=200324 RepID=A0A2N5U2Z8_9BASI|nr:hypothetical protein PCANC_22795 [Puccinia coronata f. sp. avenae]
MLARPGLMGWEGQLTRPNLTNAFMRVRLADPGLARGVQSPACPPPHAARHVHAYNRRAHGEQACQTGVQSLHACLEGVQSLHALWTGVQALHACRLTVREVPLSPGSRQPLDLRGLREPRNRDYVHRSSDRAAHVSLSNREAYVSQPRSVPLELTWARVPKPATKHTNPSPRTAPPLNGPTTAGLVLVQKGPEGPLLDQQKASSDPQTPHQAQKGGWAFCWSKRGLKGPFLAQKKASSHPQTPHQAQKGPAKPHLG